MNDRTSREAGTREFTARKGYTPPSLLPKPTQIPGRKFRYIRTSTLGSDDAKNVSSRFREGWVPVLAKDHPELEVKANRNGNVEIGGLILCQTAEETVNDRNQYYSGIAQNQQESVDNSFLRHNDPRMPMLAPERRTKVTFGVGDSPKTE